MTRDEHRRLVNEMLGLVGADHQARASELLTTLSDDYESVLTESEGHATRVSELTANNETLRAVNAKLFLKVGEVPNTPPNDPTPPSDEPDTPKITFESLFNDKGELM